MAVGSPTNLKRTLPKGFQAQFRGASLWDLVQMECLARNRRVVRVTTVGNIGYLYFDGGNVVHAATLDSEGEDAAFQMLEWSHGSFEPCEREWPSNHSISISWQNLMLKAAHANDEIGRHKLIGLPHAERLPEPGGAKTTTESQMTMKAPQGKLSLQEDDVEVAVRLASDGEIVGMTGDAEEFANMAAYACRIVEILGELMGMEGFKGLECTFKQGRCFMVKESDGTLLAFKPKREANLALIKERTGL